MRVYDSSHPRRAGRIQRMNPHALRRPEFRMLFEPTNNRITCFFAWGRLAHGRLDTQIMIEGGEVILPGLQRCDRLGGGLYPVSADITVFPWLANVIQPQRHNFGVDDGTRTHTPKDKYLKPARMPFRHIDKLAIQDKLTKIAIPLVPREGFEPSMPKRCALNAVCLPFHQRGKT